MVLRIRLARLSRRHSPHYNIVLARDRTARDSKPLEVLGTYNPTPQTPLATHDTPAQTLNPVTGQMEEYKPRQYKDVKLDVSRTKYWLGVGAQPSEGVQGILGLLGLWEGRPGTKERLGLGRPKGEGVAGSGKEVGRGKKKGETV